LKLNGWKVKKRRENKHWILFFFDIFCLVFSLKKNKYKIWLRIMELKIAHVKNYEPVPAEKHRKSLEHGSSIPVGNLADVFRRFPASSCRKAQEVGRNPPQKIRTISGRNTACMFQRFAVFSCRIRWPESSIWEYKKFKIKITYWTGKNKTNTNTGPRWNRHGRKRPYTEKYDDLHVIVLRPYIYVWYTEIYGDIRRKKRSFTDSVHGGRIRFLFCSILLRIRTRTSLDYVIIIIFFVCTNRWNQEILYYVIFERPLPSRRIIKCNNWLTPPPHKLDYVILEWSQNSQVFQVVTAK
jgi:hypothetical protein